MVPSSQTVRVWLIPLAAMTLVFAVLLGAIPYAPGYGWIRQPLGLMVWQMWGVKEGLIDFTYCQLVPVICLVLIYFKKDEIMRVPIKGENWALSLVLLGFFIFWMGMKAAMQYYGFVAVQVLIVGMVLWIWGRKVLSLIFFPWLFLMFAWPIAFLDSVVAFPLRMVMSHCASIVLNIGGIPCVQNGTAIVSAPDSHLGYRMGERFQIDIADPCSGMHSLFALMMMSALAGYIFTRPVWKRCLVFAASVPLAIFGNLVRIVLLTWATVHFGAAFAIGTEENPTWFHMGAGWAVYVVALLSLAGFISLLNADWSRWIPRLHRRPSSS